MCKRAPLGCEVGISHCIKLCTLQSELEIHSKHKTCDAEREPQTVQTYKPRSLCMHSLLHGSTCLGYFWCIIVAFRGHGFHALRLMCSSPLLRLVFPAYFELRQYSVESMHAGLFQRGWFQNNREPYQCKPFKEVLRNRAFGGRVAAIYVCLEPAVHCLRMKPPTLKQPHTQAPNSLRGTKGVPSQGV